MNLSLTIPVYNSCDVLAELVRRVNEVLIPLELEYEIILVNDASPDNRTWEKIEELCRQHSRVVGINHRRNYGQDNAIMTALRYAKGDFAVIMDDDLQHAPEDIPALLAEIRRSGDDVVYGNYSIKHQAFWKNLGSWFNGKVAEWVLDKPKHIYLSPFKILRKEVYKAILYYKGTYPYVDGLLYQVTNRFSEIKVKHHKRFAGRSNYTLLRSIRVWVRLASSFSVRPLQMMTFLGFLISILALIAASGVIVYRLIFPEDFTSSALGWSSLIVSIYFLGGIQMVFLGMLGEYAGRTHILVSRSPQSSVAEAINTIKIES